MKIALCFVDPNTLPHPPSRISLPVQQAVNLRQKQGQKLGDNVSNVPARTVRRNLHYNAAIEIDRGKGGGKLAPTRGVLQKKPLIYFLALRWRIPPLKIVLVAETLCGAKYFGEHGDTCGLVVCGLKF